MVAEINPDRTPEELADGMSATYTGREAYGKLLGTCLVVVWLEVILSFVPPKTLKKLFPPLVSGVCVLLIGAPLTGTGLKYWGGGVWCMEHNDERGYSHDFGVAPSCSGNGEVKLPYGSTEYVALGSSCFFMMIFVEMFGNPFAKNCNVVISLIFGYIVACFASLSKEHPKSLVAGGYNGKWDSAMAGNGGMTLKDGVPSCTETNFPGAFSKFNPCDADNSGTIDYVTSAKIDLAPAGTFLWVETFPLGFYGPAFFPLLIGVLVSTVESIGDIQASANASKIKEENQYSEEEFQEDVNQRVQGGLLADGLNSFLAALFTQLPNTTYSQNNGVIALTSCGSKAAGIACALWLIGFGVFAKISAVITSIPDCVLGGVTTFLFANIVVSGIRIIATDKDFMRGDRRARTILTISLGLGLGVTMKPQWAEHAFAFGDMYGFWPKADTCATWTRTLPDGNTTLISERWKPAGCGNGCDEATWAKLGGVSNCAEWGGSRSFRDAVILFLKTPNCIGPMVALLLNLILPTTSDGFNFFAGEAPDATEKSAASV
eukprot:COSAG01_NODE_1942_length_8842_cov_5.900492_5_plen_546_part_00